MGDGRVSCGEFQRQENLSVCLPDVFLQYPMDPANAHVVYLTHSGTKGQRAHPLQVSADVLVSKIEALP